MKCILCAKEISKENATWINENNALCPECAELASKQEETTCEFDYSADEKNKTGSTIQVVAMIVWILGGLSVIAFSFLSGKFSLTTMILGLFSTFTSGLMIYGMGEIIILLGEINDKLSKRKK